MKRAHLVAAIAGAVILGFVGGMALADGSASSQPAPAAPSSADVPVEVARSAPGPTTARAGMPAGFAHDEAGARAAAMAHASASQRWLYLDDAGVEAAVAAIATPTAAPGLVREVLAEVRTARESLSTAAGRVWWVVRPLAVRVESYTPDRARIAVWSVTVLSAADVALPQSDWLTVTVELVWLDGDWRVDAVTDTAGPTPMVGPRDQPWQPEPFDDALAGFARVEVGER